jgi:hypothetical protein
MTWPIKKLYGINVDPSLVGSRQVAQNPAGKAATAPVQVHKHARNGKAPDAWLINQLFEAANQGILYRTKEVFSPPGLILLFGNAPPLSAGAGDRWRWRFAFHTGVYSRALLVNMIMYPPAGPGVVLTKNSMTRVDIYDNATYAGSPVGTATFNYGSNPGGTTVVYGLTYLRQSKRYIEGLTPDTDYYGIVNDADEGRAVSCSIAEIQSMTETFSGYLPQSITAESSILDVYREKLAAVTYNLWRRSAATVFTFSIEEVGASRPIASATPTNIIDGASTTYGASIAGYQLDMTRKARLSQLTTGVPIRFCAFIEVPAANTGVVTLRDSTGTAVVTLTQVGAYTGWVTGTGLLPASEDKYYITHHRSAGAGTVKTYAVSCYEYE